MDLVSVGERRRFKYCKFSFKAYNNGNATNLKGCTNIMATTKTSSTKRKTTTKKAAPKKTTTTKRPTAKAASTRRSPAKKTTTKRPATKSTPAKRAKKTSSPQSFKLQRNDEPFVSLKITVQTLYWLILAGAVLLLGLWVLDISQKVQTIYDEIETNMIIQRDLDERELEIIREKNNRD